jgi:hypothetical protein
MKCYTCNDTFRTHEDFRDHQPCEDTREMQFEREVATLKKENADLKEQLKACEEYNTTFLYGH